MARWSDIIPKFWEQLERDMRETGEFNLARLNHAKLRQAHYAGRAVALPETDNGVPRSPIWAYAARLKTKDPFLQEFAWFYVRKDKEGNGVLRSLAEKLVASAPPEISFFGFSKRLAAMRIFERYDLVAVTKYNMPGVEEWAKGLGIYDRLPEETASRTEPPNPQEGERWLFVPKKLVLQG